jgi:hypothetical protein
MRMWATKNRVLMEKVQRAHFHHSYGLGGDSGLTYQSCRFCGTAGFENEDPHGDPACPIPKLTGRPCRGLWKYAVRHYVCDACRCDILLGLPPASGHELNVTGCVACNGRKGGLARSARKTAAVRRNARCPRPRARRKPTPPS